MQASLALVKESNNKLIKTKQNSYAVVQPVVTQEPEMGDFLAHRSSRLA